jgi:hypothetical protein
MTKVTMTVTQVIACTIGILLLVPFAHAETIDVSCQVVAPAGITAQALTDKKTSLCHGFTLKKGKNILAHVEGDFLGSGLILVSNDGERAVFIQSWFFGRLRGDGNLIASGLHYDAIPILNDGLVFFYKGKKTASYTMEELIHRPNLVQATTSHVHWLSEHRAFLGKPLGDTLTLETSSFRRYRFNTQTGSMLSSEDTEAWSRCAYVAYGEVHFDRQPIMDPVFTAKGNIPDKITFRIPPGLRVQAGYQTLCLDRRATGWSVKGHLPKLNGLSVAPQATEEARFECEQDADCELHCAAGAVNRLWFETHRSGLRACDGECEAQGRKAVCLRRSCVVKSPSARFDRACTRRR